MFIAGGEAHQIHFVGVQENGTHRLGGTVTEPVETEGNRSLTLMRIDPGLLTFSDPLGVGGKSTAALQRETTTLPNQCVAHFHAKPFFGFHLLARANGWVNFCGHKRVRLHERRGPFHQG